MDQEKKEAMMKQFEDTFGPEEELEPALMMYRYTDEALGTCIKHPLVFSIIHHDRLNHMINEAYRQKRRIVDEAHAKGEWHTYVWMHERPYRLQAFMEICDEIEDNCAYWNLLGSIWTDSENIWQDYANWQVALHAERDCKESMMDEDEQNFLADLPERFLVYRGFNESDEAGEGAGMEGFSFSMSKERATWFAKRFESHRGKAIVATATVAKSDVIAYLNGRGEEEIVILPENLLTVKLDEV